MEAELVLAVSADGEKKKSFKQLWRASEQEFSINIDTRDVPASDNYQDNLCTCLAWSQDACS